MIIKKNNQYMVGIDSDGTMFDSMTVKHTYAFIPCMIRKWNMQSIEKEVYRIAEHINLYSGERGINRFPGLVRTFDELKKSVGEKFPIENYESLCDFTQSEYPMSNNGLSDYIDKHNDTFLKSVLEWSKEADAVFSEKMKEKPPFAKAVEAVSEIYKEADLGIISSASQKGLEADWGKWGILKYMCFAAGQEYGGKGKQLSLVLKAGYDREKSIMIGDGLGDLEAAEENGIFFYPIIPGCEEESWEAFGKIYFPLLKDGRYVQAQRELIDKFRKHL